MKSKTKQHLTIGIALGLVIFGIMYGRIRGTTPTHLDAFAKCLGDKKATFYGAFWCPHCQAQKKLFGSADRLLPYVECSTPDANGVTDVCVKAGVKGYPTWAFADGSRREGEMSLNDLSDKTGCILANEKGPSQ